MKDLKNLEKICPLCSSDNHCAMAAGGSAESCWCQNVTLNAEALAAIPEAAKGKHCICAACGTTYQDATNDR